MKTIIKTIFFIIISVSVLESDISLADDTELYVLDVNSQAGVQPRVMIIFDDSGSMASNVYVKEPFTPTASYDRVYWSINGSVPSVNSSNYFNASVNNCNASLIPLTNVGYFTDVAKYFRNNSWQGLGTRHSNPVDCKTDLVSSDMNNPGTAVVGFPSDTTNSGYTTDSTKKSTAFSGSAVTFYSSAYVAWYHSAGTTQGARLQIAKDTINNLITSTPNVDYGLTTFNQNDNDGAAYAGSDDGGRIAFASKNANDTASDTDSNALFRQSLINTINNLSADTWTPLSETFYEVAHYWQGQNIWKGKWNGTPAYDPDAMLSGLTQYKTPFDSCHNHGYVILITDGAPTHDTAANSLITNEYINATNLSAAELSGWGKSLSYSESGTSKTSYLPALSGYLNHKDQNASLSGDQTVTTYTIGFGDDAMSNAQDLLEATATQGGGKYYPALNATELGAALQNIIIDILNQQYSMLAPATASSTADHSQYLENLYYSIFVPGQGPGWTGNLKKLKYSNSLGYIVDKNNNPAITSTGKIVSNATTFWSSAVDGDSLTKGGVQGMLSQKTNRTVYTNNGTTLAALNTTNLLSIAGSQTQLVSDLSVADSTAIDDQVSWMVGHDVDGTNSVSGLANREAVLADMMHSKPLVINYGIQTTGSEPDLRIVVGTNAGFVHMFKDSGATVDESWSFIPYPLLKNQLALRENELSTSHIYGMDGSAVSYILDKNNDGKIKATDNDIAWVFIGQRQGGKSYYALDVTNPDTPSLKWNITGGTTSGFERLGYTWSPPQTTKIPGYNQPVLIFGGGYDTNKDGSGIGTVDTIGNAIYIVDAATGGANFKYVVSPDNTANLRETGMTDSIPSGITLLDSDGDGVTDRLYAADTGGNVWRMDLGSTDKTKWSIFKFASLGSDDTANQDRRFFGAPIVARGINQKVTKITSGATSTYTSSEAPFDAVLVGSGNANKPASDKTVNNAYFMLRDYQLGAYLVSSPKPSAIVIDDLYDISTKPNTSDLDVRAALTSAKGWKYWLSGSGEKVYGSGAVVEGTLSFSSFLPEASQNQDVCSIGSSIGTTRIYSINMYYGTYTGQLPYTSTNDMRIENLSIYVGNNKKIQLLGVVADTSNAANASSVRASTLIQTNGSTAPTRQYEYLHDN